MMISSTELIKSKRKGYLKDFTVRIRLPDDDSAERAIDGLKKISYCWSDNLARLIENQ